MLTDAKLDHALLARAAQHQVEKGIMANHMQDVAAAAAAAKCR